MIILFAFNTLVNLLEASSLTASLKHVTLGPAPTAEQGTLNEGLYLDIQYRPEGGLGNGWDSGELEVTAFLVDTVAARHKKDAGNRGRAARTQNMAAAIHRVLQGAKGDGLATYEGRFNSLQRQEVTGEQVGPQLYIIEQRYICRAEDNSADVKRDLTTLVASVHPNVEFDN